MQARYAIEGIHDRPSAMRCGRIAQTMRGRRPKASLRCGRLLARLWVCGAFLSTAGCDGGCRGKTAPTQASAPPRVSVPTVRSWQTTLHARGSAGAIFRELKSLTLNEEQNAELANAGAAFEAAANTASEVDAGSLRTELHGALAELINEVKAGKVDLEKLGSIEARLGRADELRHQRECDALNRIQRTLTPAQKKAVAGAVRRVGLNPRAEGAGVVSRPDAATPGMPADASSPAPKQAETSWARARLESYVSGLGLDPTQKAKVKTILDTDSTLNSAHNTEAEQEAMLLDAFEGEGFDAHRFRFGDSQDGRAPFFRLVRFVAKVVPILTPDQQRTLASKLVEPPASPKRHHRSGGGNEDPE